ncbi:MAG: MaoC family dehydratase [Acidobacteria bacterium]|nr:MaoC family dehydratase [Acidobacteriota bacterium]
MKRIFASIEELRAAVGQEAAVSDWVEVTQERINLFAEATGDRQWIHLDEERARRESPYGATIAHGFLTLALLSFLRGEAFTVEGSFRHAINYGLNKVRFTGPVVAGGRVRARFTLAALEEHDWGVHTVWAVTMEAEGVAKPVLVAEWLVRQYR